MKGRLKNIFDAVTSIQTALLRFSNEEGQQSLQIRVVYSDDYLIQCILPDEMPTQLQILNKKIHLIQKYHNDYFFISGNIIGQTQGDNRVLSLAVKKAFWFVRRKKENISWFQEKYIFESRQALNLAS